MKPSRLLLIGLLALVVWALLSAATYVGWIHGTDHRDFYPRWAGARLALFEGRDPYSVETTRAMQLLLYDKEIPPDRDQQAFAYPAILIPVLLPFWYVENVEVATALWEGLSIMLLFGWLMLLRGTQDDRSPVRVLLLLMAWLYVLIMIFQAQITAVPFGAVAAGYWAYTARRDVLLGLALVPGLIKPELVAVPIVALLGLALVERRFRALIAFGGGAVALFLASIAIAGWWVPRWLDAIDRYAEYAQTAWAFRTAWDASPLLAALLAGYVGGALALAQWSPRAVLMLAVPLGHLLLPQTLIWGLTMLLIPLALAYPQARRPVLAVWLIGWLMVAGSGVGGWWKTQNLVLPALALGAAAYASRCTAPQPDAALAPVSEPL